jgi:hypothetical protein
MTDKFRDMGLVLNEETVQRLADMNEQMRVADERSRMAGMGLGAVMVPVLVNLKNAWTDATVALANYIQHLQNLPQVGWLKMLHTQNLDQFKSDRQDYSVYGPQGKPTAPKPSGSTRSRSGGSSGGTVYGTIAEMTSDPSMGGQNWDFTPAGDKLKDVIITSTYQGVTDGLENTRAEITDSYRDAISGGLYAAVYGGGKGLMEYLADTFRRKFIDNLANGLANVLSSGFGGGGSAATATTTAGKIFNFGRKLFGFANGGSFQVGGVGGIDSQLVAFKASPNERVSITKPGQDMGAGGAIAVHVSPSPYFDVAVQRVAGPMAVNAAMGGAAIAERRMQRRSRRAI